MVSRSRWLIAVVIACIAVAAGSPLRADSEAPPHSYLKVSPGGQYVFAMIVPGPVEHEVRLHPDAAARIRELRQVYPRSGLYRRNGSPEPLWTVDWYAFEVDVASDGVHLVRHGPWASSTDQEALSFFANGALLRSYKIRKLVDHPSMLEYTVSHFFWRASGRFDDARLEYKLRTRDWNRFTFDARTGEISSEFRPLRTILLGALLVAGALALGILAWLVVQVGRRVRRQATGA